MRRKKFCHSGCATCDQSGAPKNAHMDRRRRLRLETATISPAIVTALAEIDAAIIGRI
jgi:hypothetical protein